jgi:hypothetical protein
MRSMCSRLRMVVGMRANVPHRCRILGESRSSATPLCDNETVQYSEPQIPDWERLNPDEFEETVVAMLHREHPTVGKTFDGRGGDGGIDFIVESPAGDTIYQVKHFTGRIGRPQKRQIEHSLRRVANRKMSAWILVIPMELTRNEDEWFQTLAGDRGVVCRWYGRKWLNQLISTHDDIRFAMLSPAGAARAEIQDRLAAIGNPVVSLDDIVRSQHALGGIAAKLSPGFDVYTASTPHGTEVTLTPKPGSGFQFNFDTIRKHAGDDVFEQLRFGRPVGFEAPPSVIGLPDDLFDGRTGQWRMEGEPTPTTQMRLEAVNAHGRVLAELLFPEAAGTRGFAGVELAVTDRSGWVTAALQIEPRTAFLNIGIDATGSAFPDDLAPVVDFFEAVRETGLIRGVLRVDDREIRGEPMAIAATEELVGSAFARYVHDVRYLQRYTGNRHLISIDAAHDSQALRDFVRMLEGEVLHPDGTLDADMISIPDELIFAPGEGQALVVRDELVGFTIQDVEHRPPTLVRQITCARVEIDNRDDVIQARASGTGCNVHFRPVGGEQWHMTLGEKVDVSS